MRTRRGALLGLLIVMTAPTCAQSTLQSIHPSGVTLSLAQTLDWLDAETSDGPGRLSIWRSGPGGSLTLAGAPSYPTGIGTANSGAAVRIGSETLFVSGHEDGHVLIRRWSQHDLELVKAVDAGPRPLPPIPSASTMSVG